MTSHRKKSQVLTMLKESFLQLCKVSVTFKGKIEVDGIICISAEDEELVVKMHETFRKEDGCTMETRAADTSSSIEVTHNEDQGATKPRQASGSIAESVGMPQSTDHDLEEEEPENVNYENEGNSQRNTKSPKMHGDERKEKTDVKVDQMRLPVMIKEEPKESLSGFQTELPDYEHPNEDQTTRGSSDHSLDLSSSFLQESSAMDFSLMFSGMRDSSDGGFPGKGVDRSRVPKVYDNPTLECTQCDEKFRVPEEFHAHNEEVHRKFVCAFCARAYSNRANLERHTRLHTGYRPYICAVCNQKYTRKDDLKNHMLKHSNLPKPYRCGECDRNYAQKSVLRLHFRSCHNLNLEHVCMECGLGFGNKDSYVDHTIEHLNSTPITHTCSKCTFKTTAFVTYVEHELTHTVDHIPKDITDSSVLSPSDNPNSPGKQAVEILAGPAPIEIIMDKDQSPEPVEESPVEEMEMSCLGCDQEFQDKVKFSSHFDIHASEKDTIFECAWCSEILSSLGDLRSHEKEHPEYAQDIEKASENALQESPLKITNVTHIEGDIEDCEREPPDLLVAEAVKKLAAPFPKRLRKESVGSESRRRSRSSSRSPALPMSIRLGSSSRESTPTRTKRARVDPSAIEISDDEGSNSNLSVPLQDIAPGGFPNLAAVAATDIDTMATVEGHPFVMSQPVPATSEGKVSPAALGLPSQYTCSICKQIFMAYEEYEYHLGTLHGKCACMFCGQMFGNSSNRERHVRLHTGEKPYHCQYCNEGFVRTDMKKFHEAKCPSKPGYS